MTYFYGDIPHMYHSRLSDFNEVMGCGVDMNLTITIYIGCSGQL